jgi:hypothetical protein
MYRESTKTDNPARVATPRRARRRRHSREWNNMCALLMEIFIILHIGVIGISHVVT